MATQSKNCKNRIVWVCLNRNNKVLCMLLVNLWWTNGGLIYSIIDLMLLLLDRLMLDLVLARINSMAESPGFGALFLLMWGNIPPDYRTSFSWFLEQNQSIHLVGEIIDHFPWLCRDISLCSEVLLMELSNVMKKVSPRLNPCYFTFDPGRGV